MVLIFKKKEYNLLTFNISARFVSCFVEIYFYFKKMILFKKCSIKIRRRLSVEFLPL